MLRKWAFALTATGLAACGRQDAQTPTAEAPLVQQRAAPQRAETMAGELTAAGIPATYRAFFADDQLTRISETRPQAAQDAQRGDAEYDFKGARLLKYSGASLSGADRTELEFDLQGALLTARGNSGDVPQEEISAIRTRAQTLRSHALARRAAQAHAGH